jgi:hypothetical protein
LREAALGPDQHGERTGRHSPQGCQRGGDRRGFVAEDQPPLRVPFGQPFREPPGRLDVRQRQDAALLRRFHDVGGHPLQVDPAHLRELGQDGAEPPGAHLHSLLRQVVEPGMLQGREEVVQVGKRGLLPDLLLHVQQALLATPRNDPRTPFAVAAVEEQDWIADRHAQHVEEVIGLGPRRRELKAGMEAGAHKKALAGEIVGHRCSEPP